MTKMTNVKALLLTFCAVGVLTAANQSWADSSITNCAQVSATVEADVDSMPNSKASEADLLAAFTVPTETNKLEDDEACAPITVQSIFDFGDAPKSYGTDGTTAAKHEIIPGLKLGATVDEEADGQPDATATLDGADEDGVNIPTLTDGQALTLKVTATNETDKDAIIGCWIDYDGNGTFDSSEYGGASLVKGSAGSIVDVVMPAVPADASSKMKDGTYARCRLSTDTIDGAKATGAMSDGEVEDYKVTFASVPVFDLALLKHLADGQAGTAKPGDTVKFTIEVRNQGTVEAKDVVVTDYIPAGLTLADAAWTDNADGTATLKTPIATLAAGGSTTVDVSFTVKAGATAGKLTNAAEISAAKDKDGNPATDIDSTADNNPANESGITDDVVDNTGGDEDDHDIADITIVVDPKVDIELLKTVGDKDGKTITNVRRGDTVVYTLTATNKGPDAATGVTVKDQLPATLIYVSDDSSGKYDAATGAWTVGDMANGESKLLKITTTVK
jgi:uncharacterized repeat protein (TIGR01451 family)